MSTRYSLADPVRDGVPFVIITLFWTVITAIVYGAFVLVWPSIPDAEPYVHLGVYVLPLVGFLGHVLQQALRPNSA